MENMFQVERPFAAEVRNRLTSLAFVTVYWIIYCGSYIVYLASVSLIVTIPGLFYCVEELSP